MSQEPAPFSDSLEHILAEVKRLDLMLRRAVLLARQTRSPNGPEEFRGLVISEEHVDQMLDSVDFLGDIWKLEEASRTTAQQIDQELSRQESGIRYRMGASAQAGVTLTLARLAVVCGLSPAEVDVLLIALAPELEPRYETLYSYLQNDVTRKRPSVDLCLNIICRTEREKIQARELFSADAPLHHFHLIELLEEPYDRNPTLLRRFVKIDDTVSRFLLGQRPVKRDAGQFMVPESGISSLSTTVESRDKLESLLDTLECRGGTSTVIQLWGAEGAPLKEAAEAFAYAFNKCVLYAELPRLESDQAKLATLFRDAVLWDSLLVLDCGSSETSEAEREKRTRTEEWLWACISDSQIPVVLLSSEERCGSFPQTIQLWRIKIDLPDYVVRREAWQASLAGTVSDLDADRLADLFPFSGKRIQQTANLAMTNARLRAPKDPLPVMADILTAGRDLTTPGLQRFALMIQPQYEWDDLVLPKDHLQQLKAVASRIRFRNIVHRDWGFGQKMTRGKGLSVLFSGPSGTGKTMAAEVLARDLSLHLFQIDLSTVVSKYIGETERNLSVIFREAELSQSLLFFDEADALFGKRTEVKDAHDRYANIEVNYLLQRIEQYQGLVVLATNFQKNLDEAFLRRLHCVVEFPFPDEQSRKQIWALHFPSQAPRDPDLDFRFLAAQFKLAGGSIRNVAIESAYIAAQEGGGEGCITMQHVIEAIKHEHQKQGKLVMKSDLGLYAQAS